MHFLSVGYTYNSVVLTAIANHIRHWALLVQTNDKQSF